MHTHPLRFVQGRRNDNRFLTGFDIRLVEAEYGERLAVVDSVCKRFALPADLLAGHAVVVTVQ